MTGAPPTTSTTSDAGPAAGRKRIRGLVLRADGTNCERETATALTMAGASATVAHIAEVARDPAALTEAEIVVFVGGFSYGDDLGAGRIQAEEIRATFADRIVGHLDRGGLVLGICNGFQVLVKLGLLPEVKPEAASPDVSLTWNDCGRYVDRWVHLDVASRKSPFLRALPDRVEFPIAHAEGKIVVRDDAVLARLEANDQIALRYVRPDGRPAAGFPHNPNGSAGDIAGLTDPTGRVLGLMPHPERNLRPVQHPTGRALPAQPDGAAFFASAVETLRAE